MNFSQMWNLVPKVPEKNLSFSEILHPWNLALVQENSGLGSKNQTCDAHNMFWLTYKSESVNCHSTPEESYCRQYSLKWQCFNRHNKFYKWLFAPETSSR